MKPNHLLHPPFYAPATFDAFAPACERGASPTLFWSPGDGYARGGERWLPDTPDRAALLRALRSAAWTTAAFNARVQHEPAAVPMPPEFAHLTQRGPCCCCPLLNDAGWRALWALETADCVGAHTPT